MLHIITENPAKPSHDAAANGFPAVPPHSKKQVFCWKKCSFLEPSEEIFPCSMSCSHARGLAAVAFTQN